MSTQTQIQISQIGQIALPVQDLERAIAFYRDVLGLSFLFQTPTLAFFQCGEVRLMLSIPEGPPEAHHASVLYYKVDNLHDCYETFRHRGVALIDEPHLIAKMPDHELWMFFFKDTEGNMMALMSEVKPR